MQTPVDLNKLKAILNKSKAIMKTVDSNNYNTGNINGGDLVQEGLVTSLPNDATPIASSTHKQKTITENMIDNSKLPESIKMAMKNNPIPIPQSINHTFELDDVMEKPLPPPTSRSNIRENITQPKSDLNEDRIRTIVSEEMSKFFSGYFMKQITESIQKQTIKNLIDVGIIKRKITK
jgi:hypothetical protein